MQVFKINEETNKIKIVEPKKNLENEIHKLISNNLETTNDAIFLENEKTITTVFEFDEKKYRIDTIAIGSNAEPIIIEYKKDKSVQILNQAATYMEWLKNNKAEFKELIRKKASEINPKNLDEVILKGLNSGTDKYFNLNNISWDEARIVLIARTFDKQTKATAKFMNIKMELIEYELFNDFLWLNTVFSTKPKISENILETKAISEDKYRNDYFESYIAKNEKAALLVDFLENIVIEKLDDYTIIKNKFYRAVKKNKNIFSYIIPRKKDDVITIYTSEKNIIKKMNFEKVEKGHWGTGDFFKDINTKEEIEILIEILLDL